MTDAELLAWRARAQRYLWQRDVPADKHEDLLQEMCLYAWEHQGIMLDIAVVYWRAYDALWLAYRRGHAGEQRVWLWNIERSIDDVMTRLPFQERKLSDDTAEKFMLSSRLTPLAKIQYAETMEAIEAKFRAEDIHQAIATLPEKQRYVVHQFFYEEQLWQDIAARLGIDPSAVSLRFKAAIPRLQRRLRPYQDDRPGVRTLVRHGEDTPRKRQAREGMRRLAAKRKALAAVS